MLWRESSEARKKVGLRGSLGSMATEDVSPKWRIDSSNIESSSRGHWLRSKLGAERKRSWSRIVTRSGCREADASRTPRSLAGSRPLEGKRSCFHGTGYSFAPSVD